MPPLSGRRHGKAASHHQSLAAGRDIIFAILSIARAIANIEESTSSRHDVDDARVDARSTSSFTMTVDTNRSATMSIFAGMPSIYLTIFVRPLAPHIDDITPFIDEETARDGIARHISPSAVSQPAITKPARYARSARQGPGRTSVNIRRPSFSFHRSWPACHARRQRHASCRYYCRDGDIYMRCSKLCHAVYAMSIFNVGHFRPPLARPSPPGRHVRHLPRRAAPCVRRRHPAHFGRPAYPPRHCVGAPRPARSPARSPCRRCHAPPPACAPARHAAGAMPWPRPGHAPR